MLQDSAQKEIQNHLKLLFELEAEFISERGADAAESIPEESMDYVELLIVFNYPQQLLSHHSLLFRRQRLRLALPA